MRQEELKKMYGAVPDSFRHRIAFALRETEGRNMKRRIKTRTVWVAAVLLIALTAAAYAAFSSKTQVSAFFGGLYGKEMQLWLEKGDVAAVNQSFTLDEVEFTLDEVVYRDDSLYGLGTIRPREGSRAVIIAESHLPSEPYGYDIYGEGGTPEQAPADAPTIADMAKEREGRMLVVRALPDLIGVDGGEMLSPGTVGYSLAPQRDGSIRFSFQLTDYKAVGKGELYAIRMWVSVYETAVDGSPADNTQHGENWTVQINPLPISEPSPDAAEAAGQLEPVNPAERVQPGKPEIIVPDAYTQTGTLPIYRATTRDFSEQLQPEMFNQSGIASRNKGSIVFKDEAILQFGPEALFYWENSGTFDANAGTALEPNWVPRPAMSNAISSLAARAAAKPEGDPLGRLEKTALPAISLDEAKQKLETLLDKLGLTGYVMDYALDMNAGRILAMDAEQTALIAANQLMTNIPRTDFSQLAPEDEGFFLSYHQPGNGRNQGNGDLFSVYAYVTEKGVVDASIRDMCIPGDVYDTPETLVSPEDILARLPQEVAASRFPEKVASVSSMRLTYAPVRAADKADGMMLTPVWLVIYQDEQAAAQDYICWAEFDAVNGELLGAIFK